MTHFGVLCPAMPGHLNPMATLGRALQQRGHQITFLQILDVKTKVLAEGLDFYPIGQADFPPGTLNQIHTQRGELSGMAAVRHTIDSFKSLTAMIFRDVPGAIQAVGVETLLVDQTLPAGATVAEFLNIPFITVCNALAMNKEIGVPPLLTPWGYQSAWWSRLRNQMGYHFFSALVQSVENFIAEYRRQWKLPAYSNINDSFSKLAQVSQQTAAFDFPRTTLPKYFHYTGPFLDNARAPIAFPFEKLTGQPLIYASLGTEQNRIHEIFRCIAAACAGLNAQLVISLGGGSSLKEIQDLPGSPLVVEYAPQLELLAKARLTITHAGLNTVLESLSNGVPMVAIPITNDQPAVGARLQWVGAGEVVPLARLNVPKLRAVIERVLRDDAYLSAAARLKESIRQSRGVMQAADVVEQAVKTGCPVLHV